MKNVEAHIDNNKGDSRYVAYTYTTTTTIDHSII